MPGAHAGPVDEVEPGWRPGDQILIDLPDGQTVRARIVNITDEDTIQVVPDDDVVAGRPLERPAPRRDRPHLGRRIFFEVESRVPDLREQARGGYIDAGRRAPSGSRSGRSPRHEG